MCCLVFSSCGLDKNCEVKMPFGSPCPDLHHCKAHVLQVSMLQRLTSHRNALMLTSEDMCTSHPQGPTAHKQIQHTFALQTGDTLLRHLIPFAVFISLGGRASVEHTLVQPSHAPPDRPALPVLCYIISLHTCMADVSVSTSSNKDLQPDKAMHMVCTQI